MKLRIKKDQLQAKIDGVWYNAIKASFPISCAGCFFNQKGRCTSHAILCSPLYQLLGKTAQFREIKKPKNSAFKKALRNVKAGDVVRVEGATTNFHGNGEYIVADISLTWIDVKNDLYNDRGSWVYSIKSGRPICTNGGRIVAVRTKLTEWVER